MEGNHDNEEQANLKEVQWGGSFDTRRFRAFDGRRDGM
jgi:hypothetical protein